MNSERIPLIHRPLRLYYRSHYYKKKDQNLHKLKYKDKHLTFKESVKIGVCNGCRAVVPFDAPCTQTHHEYYDDNDPLKGTIELCVKCHGKESYKVSLALLRRVKT